MALDMTGHVLLPARPHQVFQALNDPDVLRACIPGCEALEKLSDTELQGGRHRQDRPGQGPLQRHRHAQRP